MGAFDERPNILIPDDDQDPEGARAFRKKWGWDPHEQAILRKKFTAGDSEDVENASSVMKGKGKKRNIEVRSGTARNLMLMKMLVSWTFTKNGVVIPISAESIRLLPSEYRKPLLEISDEIAHTMDEDEQDDFLDDVNAPSTES